VGIAWLNAMLDEVWTGRGAFPGIGSGFLLAVPSHHGNGVFRSP